MKKKLLKFTTLILFLSLCITNGITDNSAFAEEVNSVQTTVVVKRLSTGLQRHGYRTASEGSTLRFWRYNSSSIEGESILTFSESGRESVTVNVQSRINDHAETRTFLIKTSPGKNMADESVSMLLPYLLSFEKYGVKSDSTMTAREYHSSVSLGYYRTNDNSDMIPDKENGMILLNWKFTLDPLRYSRVKERTMVLGDFLDSNFNISFNKEKNKFFEVLDEFDFRIDIMIYGKHKVSDYGENRKTRSIYGLFTSMEYYRPYLNNSTLLWSDDIYTDHIYLQYCYWEPIAFRHDISRINNGKELFLSYKIGMGPGQNSSLATTNISEYEEDNYLNPIFVSNWYGQNGHGDRRHNYYYSMTFPVLVEMKADKYLNSKLDFKYSFYFFQAIQDSKVHDFLNRLSIDYGFYITSSTTIGFGYEFWRIDSRENEKNKSHMWHRINFKIEKEI